MSIILLSQVKTFIGGHGSVYYYAGNIFQPLELHGSEVGRVKKAIRQFMKDNAEMIQEDRAKPNYKNLLELFDEQYPEG